MAPPRTWNRRFTEQGGSCRHHLPSPSPPTHPRACGSAAWRQEWQQAGDPVAEHRHPPVRLFDRAARPIITPHARLLYSMPRVVLYHAESEACPRPKVP